MSKCNGNFYKHFGVKWLWVEDEMKYIKKLQNKSPKDIIEKIEKKAETMRESYNYSPFITNEIIELDTSSISKFKNKRFTKKTTKKKEKTENHDLKPKRIKHLSLDPDVKQYKSPWYVQPKYWDKLALIPAVQYGKERERAANIYYHLHERKIDPKNFSFEVEENTELDERLLNAQSQLAELPSIHRFKKYLESKSLRVPACIESINRRQDLVRNSIS
ncbi:unnamed protein product [Blepharisma stoltei]|uniref:Uncharacterized protein n=1 Tax=Blepharisma stoltei TaxID=1481888 RepID=A0AAU9KIB3_9CILI|nr:unnamed protein product [Blepharisma stoltei]